VSAEDLLSIIIPACNAEAFIKAAIESVLAQTYRPIELIVVDDGSKDRTAEIAGSFGPHLVCHRQANGGPPAARNQGLALAGGDYIGFLDADDVYEPDSCKFQIDKLRRHPGVEIVIGRLLREELAGSPGDAMTFKPVATETQIDLHLGVCIFRRRVFERVGLLDERLRHSDDWDWFMRARELGVVMLAHEEIVMRQRLHANNITRDRAANLHFLSVMLKRSLDRRRTESLPARHLPNLASYHEDAGSSEDGK
jgi:glycosyltransferase involved in cell wall biosynthesis